MPNAVVTPEREAELALDLARLRGLVEASRVEDARSLVKQLESKWPDSDEVRRWARVLAPPRVIGSAPASGGLLEQERKWIRAHGAEYPGCWVALEGDRLIAADPILKAVLEKVREAGVKDAGLHFQPRRRE